MRESQIERVIIGMNAKRHLPGTDIVVPRLSFKEHIGNETQPAPTVDGCCLKLMINIEHRLINV